MITLSFHFKSQYETTTSSTEKNEDVAVLSCQTKSSSQVVPDCIKPNTLRCTHIYTFATTIMRYLIYAYSMILVASKNDNLYKDNI